MKRMQKFLTVLATSSLLCSQLAIDTVSIYAANGQENQASTTGTTSTSSGEATASSSTSASTTESASTSTTDSSASSQEGATSQNLEVIEEAPAHEEEEKKPTLRGGNPQVTDWSYTEDGTTITLTGYTGSSTDVVIPTAQDLGFDESYTAQISKEVLQSVANNKTSLSTSTNGKKIVVSSTDLSNCFASKRSLTTM
ncbi:hypothetical protein DSH57_13275, partial [Enterococcus faecium]|nr:hypothetical protein [Enterococcus faecium]